MQESALFTYTYLLPCAFVLFVELVPVSVSGPCDVANSAGK